MPGMPPAEVLVPLVRLLLAALLGGIAGASLASVLHRRAERARDVRRSRLDARRAIALEATVRDAHDGADADAARASLTRLRERARAGELAWRRRHEAIEARERAGRRRIDTLLAEQQAAEERQSRLEAELRNLRAERDPVSRTRPASDARPRRDAGEGARPEGVPVLNRRVEAGARGTEVDDYPMLAESELPERSESLQLEDLLD